MKFVLLGGDPACLPLLRAIAHAPQHELALAAHAGASWPQIAALVPGLRQATDWQALLIEPEVAAAIVAGFAPEVLEGARALARAGIPLVVFPDVRQTSSFVYDLWPLEEAGGPPLVPLLGTAAGDTWRDVREQMHNGALGRVRFVTLERTGARDAHAPIDLTAAENHLLHDFDLLRRLCGNFSRLTCVPVGMTTNAVGELTVKLTGDDVPEATWSISAAPSEPGATLQVAGTRVTGGYQLPPLSSGGLFDPHSPACDAEGEHQLALVAHRLREKSTAPCWSDVVRAFDVVDAARRSIRRSRTVEIGSEEISEQRQFKSVMTAAGCGVLMYTLLAVVAALLIGAVADPRDAAQRRAASAGFIVRDAEFVAGTPELTPAGEAHVTVIALRLWETTADVIVEPAGAHDDSDLDAARRSAVETALVAADAAKVAGRVQTRPLEGAWFERAMIGVWVVVFAPLVVLLSMQLLGLVAKPDARE